MRPDLPSGTVTFLFTDVEGSTRLLHELGAEGYAEVLADHRRLIREACAVEGGVEVDTQGDAFFFAFPTAPGALAAAAAFTEALATGPIQVRVGLHTGAPLLTDEGYVGDDVHFAARVAASSHGGQVVLSAATADLVAMELTDLGEHRLKDIAEAIPIFQFGGGSFPPLKTISNTNLPRPASSFLGREAELGEVLSRIEAGARLVTLTGPGGTGKTRLALEVASTLVGEYKAGVFWVGLAALHDPALVTETIAQTLGAKDGLAEHVGEREMLLLLDNLEHVIEAAPELSEFLRSCSNLVLLVTSRELLRIDGEVEYAVPPLAQPEAVALFCERAQLAPSDEIAELCARLDSLPLAVELAAARTKALSPARILERLSQRLDLLKGGRDADPRQQTLRATIAWSYELLSPAEEELFARLSVFAGGCTLEAAEEVCDADIDTLQSLVEKSLLRFAPPGPEGRYWMLETIREFAFEQLAALDRTGAVRDRHLSWILGYLRDAAPRWAEPATLVGLDRVLAEDRNAAAAFERAVARERSDAALEIAGLIGRTFVETGRLVELLSVARRALALGAGDPALEGLALISSAWARTNPSGMRDDFALAIDRLGAAGRPRDAAYAQVGLGFAMAEAGDVDVGGAAELIESAAQELEGLGDAYCLSVARSNLVAVEVNRWPLRPERAHQLAAMARSELEVLRRSGDPGAETFGLTMLAMTLCAVGALEEAWDAALEAAALMRASQAGWYDLGDLLGTLAVCAHGRQDYEEALRLVGALDSFARRDGRDLSRFSQSVTSEIIDAGSAALGPTHANKAMDGGRALTVDDVLNYVSGLRSPPRAT